MCPHVLHREVWFHPYGSRASRPWSLRSLPVDGVGRDARLLVGRFLAEGRGGVRSEITATPDQPAAGRRRGGGPGRRAAQTAGGRRPGRRRGDRRLAPETTRLGA